MRNLKRPVGLTGAIATLAAGIFLLAASEGANAKGGGAREGLAVSSKPPRISVLRTSGLVGNHHHHDRCRHSYRCYAPPVRFLGPPVPAPRHTIR